MSNVVKLEQPQAKYNGNPQVEDGHTRIANELLEAIVRFDFSKRQYKVILFVIRKTYGWNKKADVMSLSQIVDGTRIDRANSSRTVNELCEMNVLLKQQQMHGQLIKLNKNYGEWRELPKQQQVAKTATKVLPKQQLGVAKTATTKDKPKNNTKRHIPIDFRISDQVRDWALEKGYSNLDAHLEWFLDWAKANKKQYADWDATFRNAIRGNWAKVNPAVSQEYVNK
jgi:phage replication O-like protein O